MLQATIDTLEAFEEFARITLAYGYTDSSHDEFCALIDRASYAYYAEEAVQDGLIPRSWEAYVGPV